MYIENHATKKIEDALFEAGKKNNKHKTIMIKEKDFRELFRHYLKTIEEGLEKETLNNNDTLLKLLNINLYLVELVRGDATLRGYKMKLK